MPHEPKNKKKNNNLKSNSILKQLSDSIQRTTSANRRWSNLPLTTYLGNANEAKLQTAISSAEKEMKN